MICGVEIIFVEISLRMTKCPDSHNKNVPK